MRSSSLQGPSQGPFEFGTWKLPKVCYHEFSLLLMHAFWSILMLNIYADPEGSQLKKEQEPGIAFILISIPLGELLCTSY